MGEIKWVSPATRFIKENSKYFTKNIKVKLVSVEPKDEFVTTSITPPVQGTMLDILFSWKSTGVMDIDKYGIIDYYLNHMIKTRKLKTKVEGIIGKFRGSYKFDDSSEQKFRCALGSATLTMGFRSGMIDDAMARFGQIMATEAGKFSVTDLEALKILDSRLDKKLNEIKKEGEYLDNPVFGGILPNGFKMKADGDYFYGGTLGDMKSSKNPKLQRTHFNQLFFYKFLNQHTLRLEIKSFEVFNPLWNVTHKIEISDIVDKSDFLND